MTKTITYNHDLYSVGAALFVPMNSKNIQDIMNKHNICKIIANSYFMAMDTDKGFDQGGIVTYSKSKLNELNGIKKEMLKYVYYYFRYHKNIKSDYIYKIPAPLKTGFPETFPQMLRATEPATIGNGYDVFRNDEGTISTHSILGFMDAGIFVGTIRDNFFAILGGTQLLWDQASKGLKDIRLNTEIKSINRTSKYVEVKINNGETLKADYIVYAIPPDKVLPYLENPTSQEKNLFSKIVYTDYRSYICEITPAENNPDRLSMYIVNNMHKYNFPTLQVYVNPYIMNNMCMVYALCEQGVDDKIVQGNIASEAKKMGAQLDKVHKTFKWDYFPRLSLKDIQNDGYDTFFEMQGDNRSYFCGQFMNYPSVEHAAANGKWVINKYFNK